MVRVLLVDEDPQSRSEYISGLTQAGHTAAAANSAQAGLDAMDEFHPDVIVLDLLLSVHNGITVLYEMMSYSDLSKIPVIVLSMVPQSQFLAEKEIWDRIHVTRYCYKPETRPADLAVVVADVMS